LSEVPFFAFPARQGKYFRLMHSRVNRKGWGLARGEDLSYLLVLEGTFVYLEDICWLFLLSVV
jgi:hypothetical protein